MTAQGITDSLTGFGRRGLWTTAQNQVLNFAYCTRADNLRLAPAGALTNRKGWVNQSSTNDTGVAGNVLQLHEYRQADQSVEMIVTWDGGIANDIDDISGSDISGSVTDADGNWFFQNFNDKCIGFQAGQKIIVYTGTGNFATVTESAGTAPTGGVGCAAYGRIWQTASDGKTLHYTTLLDETDWASTGSGTIDFNNIWTDGQDTITAVRAFNGQLVVWGKRHVIFLADTADTGDLGIDPDNLYVQDIIAGTGCVSQHTVQLVGEQDILFLSYRGVQSLGRLIQEKSNPIETLTAKIEQDIIDDIKVADGTEDTIRSVYSVSDGLYLLTVPATNHTWALEMRHMYADEDTGGLRVPVFKWTLTPYAWAYRDNADLLLGTTVTNGVVGKYDGYTDNSAVVRWRWYSPWLHVGLEQGYGDRLKILKRMNIIVETTATNEIVASWAVDFSTRFTKSVTFPVETEVTASEWNVAQWGLGEWGSNDPIQSIRRPVNESGKFYRFSLTEAADTKVTLLELSMFYKIGRVA